MCVCGLQWDVVDRQTRRQSLYLRRHRATSTCRRYQQQQQQPQPNEPGCDSSHRRLSHASLAPSDVGETSQSRGSANCPATPAPLRITSA